MADNKITLDQIIQDIESQELYQVLDEELGEEDLETLNPSKLAKKLKAEEKKELARLAKIIINDHKENQMAKKNAKKTVTFKQGKTPKIPGDASVSKYNADEDQWEVHFMGDVLCKSATLRRIHIRFWCSKPCQELNQDRLYMLDKKEKLAVVYEKEHEAAVWYRDEKDLKSANLLTVEATIEKKEKKIKKKAVTAAVAKSKAAKKATTKKSTKDTPAKKKSTLSIPVTVYGTESLEKETKAGVIVERNARVITVECITKKDKLKYKQEFNAKTGILLSSNPNHGWKLNLKEIKKSA